eukprot:m51a1_g8093 hypothetical protein (128) ;mRNA; r:56609-58159
MFLSLEAKVEERRETSGVHKLRGQGPPPVQGTTNVLTLGEAVAADEKAYGGLHQAPASRKCEHKVNESKLMNEKGFKSVHRCDHFLLAMDNFYMTCLLLDSWIYYKTINTTAAAMIAVRDTNSCVLM